MSVIADGRLSLWETMKAQGRILHAIMLRDVRTRFFGSAFGFLLAVAWPLSHIFILLAINTLIGRAAPYGDSAALWFATGIVPFMAFNYMARFTMMGLALNRPLLAFPVVNVTDILFARAILELLNAGVVILTTMLIFAFLGIDFAPIDLVQACLAIGACMLLGFGFGIVNGVVAGILPFWMTGYALFSMLMWIASGVLFVPDALPDVARYYLSFNPALQGIEWMRSAYYESYGSGVLDKEYMLGFSLIMLFFGLGLERMLRGRIMQ
ncbi:ABC transporter permease [Methylocapsa sp. S129]|uniref:ABC transporter permease n=1 Tax=Methylocapsa sp. S129 TaxID=1641869 RepID=UPI00131E9D30|nr:ABC transporter permease [Methylocapsa sp. S129]